MIETPVLDSALSIDGIRSHLFTYTVGHRLLLYGTVGSTNAALRDLARAGAAEGTVVVADAQTAGRGRGGKSWFSPPGVNLHLSLLLRPGIPATEAAPLTFITSLALADAIRELGLAPAIKWPNDVLVKHRKVAGTLAELATTGDRVDYLILGMGVNVNIGRPALTAALGEAACAATSLREALGHLVDRSSFAAALLAYLDEWLIVYREQGAGRLLRAWRERDVVTGRRVEVRDSAAIVEGRARGVNGQGELEVEDATGRIHRVVAGEIRLME
jgi:BirA family biotin operon repressor/biotin-[acetyl-CoA-carboxylase] ligase